MRVHRRDSKKTIYSKSCADTCQVIRDVIDFINKKNYDELLPFMRNGKVFEKQGRMDGELTVEFLNCFDGLLEEFSLISEENEWRLLIDNNADQRLLLKILMRYIIGLMEMNRFEGLFNSFEHLLTLMVSEDAELILSIINLIYQFVSNFHSLSNEMRTRLHRQLQYFAMSWGDKFSGFSLATCIFEKDITKLFVGLSTLHFSYLIDPEGKERTNDKQMKSFRIDSLHQIDCTISELMQCLVYKYSIPERYHMHLLHKIRLVKYFHEYEERLHLIKIRLMARCVFSHVIIQFLQKSSKSYSNIGNKMNIKTFIEEMVQVLHLSHKRIDMIEIQTIILRTIGSLTCLIFYLPNGANTKVLFEHLLDLLEIEQFHGLLGTIVRQYVSALISGEYRGLYTNEFGDALFTLLGYVYFYVPAFLKLNNNEIISTLLRLVNLYDQRNDLLRFVSRATHVLIVITMTDMETFQFHNGFEAFVNRFVHEINICREEQPFMIPEKNDDVKYKKYIEKSTKYFFKSTSSVPLKEPLMITGEQLINIILLTTSRDETDTIYTKLLNNWKLAMIHMSKVTDICNVHGKINENLKLKFRIVSTNNKQMETIPMIPKRETSDTDQQPGKRSRLELLDDIQKRTTTIDFVPITNNNNNNDYLRIMEGEDFGGEMINSPKLPFYEQLKNLRNLHRTLYNNTKSLDRYKFLHYDESDYTVLLSPQDIYDNEINGEYNVCDEERCLLLRTIVNFISINMKKRMLEETIPRLFDGCFANSLRHIISNAIYYGPLLFSLCVRLIPTFIQRNPTYISALQENSLVHTVLAAIFFKRFPIRRDILLSIPLMLKIFSYNQNGLDTILAVKPFLRIFNIFFSKGCLRQMNRNHRKSFVHSLNMLFHHITQEMKEDHRYMNGSDDLAHGVITMLQYFIVLGTSSDHMNDYSDLIPANISGTTVSIDQDVSMKTDNGMTEMEKEPIRVPYMKIMEMMISFISNYLKKSRNLNLFFHYGGTFYLWRLYFLTNTPTNMSFTPISSQIINLIITVTNSYSSYNDYWKYYSQWYLLSRLSLIDSLIYPWPQLERSILYVINEKKLFSNDQIQEAFHYCLANWSLSSTVHSLKFRSFVLDVWMCELFSCGMTQTMEMTRSMSKFRTDCTILSNFITANLYLEKFHRNSMINEEEGMLKQIHQLIYEHLNNLYRDIIRKTVRYIHKLFHMENSFRVGIHYQELRISERIPIRTIRQNLHQIHGKNGERVPGRCELDLKSIQTLRINYILGTCLQSLFSIVDKEPLLRNHVEYKIICGIYNVKVISTLILDDRPDVISSAVYVLHQFQIIETLLEYYKNCVKLFSETIVDPTFAIPEIQRKKVQNEFDQFTEAVMDLLILLYDSPKNGMKRDQYHWCRHDASDDPIYHMLYKPIRTKSRNDNHLHFWEVADMNRVPIDHLRGRKRRIDSDDSNRFNDLQLNEEYPNHQSVLSLKGFRSTKDDLIIADMGIKENREQFDQTENYDNLFMISFDYVHQFLIPLNESVESFMELLNNIVLEKNLCKSECYSIEKMMKLFHKLVEVKGRLKNYKCLRHSSPNEKVMLPWIIPLKRMTIKTALSPVFLTLKLFGLSDEFIRDLFDAKKLNKPKNYFKDVQLLYANESDFVTHMLFTILVELFDTDETITSDCILFITQYFSLERLIGMFHTFKSSLNEIYKVSINYEKLLDEWKLKYRRKMDYIKDGHRLMVDSMERLRRYNAVVTVNNKGDEDSYNLANVQNERMENSMYENYEESSILAECYRFAVKYLMSYIKMEGIDQFLLDTCTKDMFKPSNLVEAYFPLGIMTNSVDVYLYSSSVYKTAFRDPKSYMRGQERTHVVDFYSINFNYHLECKQDVRMFECLTKNHINKTTMSTTMMRRPSNLFRNTNDSKEMHERAIKKRGIKRKMDRVLSLRMLVEPIIHFTIRCLKKVPLLVGRSFDLIGSSFFLFDHWKILGMKVLSLRLLIENMMRTMTSYTYQITRDNKELEHYLYSQFHLFSLLMEEEPARAICVIAKSRFFHLLKNLVQIYFIQVDFNDTTVDQEIKTTTTTTTTTTNNKKKNNKNQFQFPSWMTVAVLLIDQIQRHTITRLRRSFALQMERCKNSAYRLWLTYSPNMAKLIRNFPLTNVANERGQIVGCRMADSYLYGIDFGTMFAYRGALHKRIPLDGVSDVDVSPAVPIPLRKNEESNVHIPPESTHDTETQSCHADDVYDEMRKENMEIEESMLYELILDEESTEMLLRSSIKIMRFERKSSDLLQSVLRLLLRLTATNIETAGKFIELNGISELLKLKKTVGFLGCIRLIILIVRNCMEDDFHSLINIERFVRLMFTAERNTISNTPIDLPNTENRRKRTNRNDQSNDSSFVRTPLCLHRAHLQRYDFIEDENTTRSTLRRRNAMKRKKDDKPVDNRYQPVIRPLDHFLAFLAPVLCRKLHVVYHVVTQLLRNSKIRSYDRKINLDPSKLPGHYYQILSDTTGNETYKTHPPLSTPLNELPTPTTATTTSSSIPADDSMNGNGGDGGNDNDGNMMENDNQMKGTYYSKQRIKHIFGDCLPFSGKIIRERQINGNTTEQQQLSSLKNSSIILTKEYLQYIYELFYTCCPEDITRLPRKEATVEPSIPQSVASTLQLCTCRLRRQDTIDNINRLFAFVQPEALEQLILNRLNEVDNMENMKKVFNPMKLLISTHHLSNDHTIIHETTKLLFEHLILMNDHPSNEYIVNRSVILQMLGEFVYAFIDASQMILPKLLQISKMDSTLIDPITLHTKSHSSMTIVSYILENVLPDCPSTLKFLCLLTSAPHSSISIHSTIVNEIKKTIQHMVEEPDSLKKYRIIKSFSYLIYVLIYDKSQVLMSHICRMHLLLIMYQKNIPNLLCLLISKLNMEYPHVLSAINVLILTVNLLTKSELTNFVYRQFYSDISDNDIAILTNQLTLNLQSPSLPNNASTPTHVPITTATTSFNNKSEIKRKRMTSRKFDFSNFSSTSKQSVDPNDLYQSPILQSNNQLNTVMMKLMQTNKQFMDRNEIFTDELIKRDLAISMKSKITRSRQSRNNMNTVLTVKLHLFLSFSMIIIWS
ncbi:hypothetical protein SNEBB_000954 [Seison nebaliae]|nr:hypothetical protein SNEBB_000954 [Seison nebaliae]